MPQADCLNRNSAPASFTKASNEMVINSAGDVEGSEMHPSVAANTSSSNEVNEEIYDDRSFYAMLLKVVKLLFSFTTIYHKFCFLEFCCVIVK